ncbi:hypothetical protein RB596_008688 [Gaeumannomyces avenae]
MHHQVIGTTGMSPEGHMSPDHNGFGGASSSGAGQHWVDMSSYTQPSPMPDYSHHSYAFGLGSMPHTLPSESIANRMPPPPLPPPPRAVQHQHQHQHPHQNQGHPHLHPLIMPSNPTWPSQLTNPGGMAQPTSYSAPPVTMPPPLGVQLKTSKMPTSHTPTTPRKTLNNEIRREMCKFAEENPLLKQTEIGSRFGVERSTVSKVLRNKDKYLNPDDRAESPIKRTFKGKSADVEKALINWFRNTVSRGAPVTDQDIRNQARFFSQTVAGSSDGLLKQLSTSAGLKMFKQKNGISSGPKLLRRASETNIPHSAAAAGLGLGGMPSMSPASPHPTAQPSPISANPGKSDDEEGGGSSLMDFTSDSADMRPTTFTFSPDPNSGGGFLTDPARGEMPGSSNFQRPRSQTFPTLDIELMNQSSQAEDPLSPKYNAVSTGPSSALESPMNEILAQPFAIDTTVTSPHLRRSSSNSSLAQRASSTPIGNGTAPTPTNGSSPSSPTQEDARRAADTLLSFIQQNAGSLIDHNDYNYVLRLTEKLRLHQSQMAKSGTPQGMMGGLSRIPEGEMEMASAPPVSMSMGTVKMEPTTMAT